MTGTGKEPEPFPGVVSTPQPVIRLTSASLGCLMLSAAESGPCLQTPRISESPINERW